MYSRRILFGILGISILSLTSCGKDDGRKPTFPVTGKVFFEKKPTEHATIIFHPIGESGSNVVKPRGKVGSDGSFTLTTYDGNDGAPAGDYAVTVELWLATGRQRYWQIQRN
jgi:hypothetical protein